MKLGKKILFSFFFSLILLSSSAQKKRKIYFENFSNEDTVTFIFGGDTIFTKKVYPDRTVTGLNEVFFDSKWRLMRNLVVINNGYRLRRYFLFPKRYIYVTNLYGFLSIEILKEPKVYM